MSKKLKTSLLVMAILLIDQVSKIVVKTSMALGECIPVFDWFKIYFIENPGMAFGMTIGSKLLLTSFRIAHFIAVVRYELL